MAMRRSEEADEAGFSLLEVLIALLLLVVGVAAVTTGFTQGHRVASEVGLRQQAFRLAHTKATEKLAQDYGTIAVPTSADERIEGAVLFGEDTVGGVSRRWAVEKDRPAPGLARVWVTVRWVRRGSIQTFCLAGLVAGEGAP